MVDDALPIERWYTAEVSVLGSLLINPDELAGEIFDRVQPSDFGNQTLRTLFKAAREIWAAQEPLDPVTLLDRAGGRYESTVRQVMTETPTWTNWADYVQHLVDAARIRRMRDIGQRLAEVETMQEGQSILAAAEDLLIERRGMQITSYAQMISGLLDRQADKAPPDYLDWGIAALNEQLSISRGRFVILAADSSVGKTALALQLSRGIAMSGKRVGFFSLETSEADAADRMMANAADISLPRIKHKRLQAADLKRIMAEGDKATQLQLDLIEAAGATAEDIRATTLAHRYDVIFIDYVQLIPARGEDRWQQVSKVSMALHTLAQQLGVTVVGLSQVTPPPVNKDGHRPELTREHLRESRQLLNDADAILIMDLVDPRNRASRRVLKVDKNKDGPCGRILLDFEASRMRFTYVPPLEDQVDEAAKALNEKKDKNRKERQEKEAAKNKQATEGQQGWTELGSTEPLPF